MRRSLSDSLEFWINRIKASDTSASVRWTEHRLFDVAYWCQCLRTHQQTSLL
ncbi:hypothetical protein DPMN_116374 [Dreissena polymorpha]|uniref:Uncharacterized protein n=1 Tax=Dreissena polymorpha TaxID=45954 RepID=A0A9D4KMY6_DREPO|nr:hypothetical protein DPMN_116374 [Dreissena polymorpha]